ncbi:MAG: hypothetical protein GY849_01850 [Deltaproteobacteria bacterium]|nr:hypothetical protein [Deltaproteobacteria bacterium]
MKRQWGAWDLRNMEQPLQLGSLHEGSGVTYFHFDREYNMAIMTGRGDNVCPVMAFNKAAPQILSTVCMHNFGQSTNKQFTVMPKQACDLSK